MSKKVLILLGSPRKNGNSDILCTRVNPDITLKMQQLVFVKIDRFFSIYEKFQQCILDLSVSQKTHYRDYYTIITELEEYIDSTKVWSLESKKQKILSSKKYHRYQKQKNLHNQNTD